MYRSYIFTSYVFMIIIINKLDLSVLADGSRLFIRMCPARISADRQVRTVCFFTLLLDISKNTYKKSPFNLLKSCVTSRKAICVRTFPLSNEDF